jgi:hypothetical protein
MDDSFLDWETRDDKFPLHKHVIAGIKHHIKLIEYRIMCRNNGACRYVSTRYSQSTLTLHLLYIFYHRLIYKLVEEI